MPQKVLWVVRYSNLDSFLSTAVEIGATRVAIRTDNDLTTAINKFHDKNIEVFGWRWPYADLTNAKLEAARAAKFFASGMDGYYADPERAPGEPWDWDRSGLESVARTFCAQVNKAAGGRTFGTTSHYRAADVFPHLPWGEFVTASSVLLPQAYWRSTGGRIGSGIPGVNYKAAIAAWEKLGVATAAIEPMAGELGVITAQEIKAYAKAAEDNGVDTLHFYDWTGSVSHEVWQAIKEI